MSSLIMNSKAIGKPAVQDAEKDAKRRIAELIRQFVGPRSEYYTREFIRLETRGPFIATFNYAAALLGPIWAASRGLWLCFWIYAFTEIFAIIQIGRGFWADLGSGHMKRAEHLLALSAERAKEAEAALKIGSENADRLSSTAEELARVAAEAESAASAAAAMGPWLIVFGVFVLVLIKILEGALSNLAYERCFTRWRSGGKSDAGVNYYHAGIGVVLVSLIYSITLYRFTAHNPTDFFLAFPADRSLSVEASRTINTVFDSLVIHGEMVFDAIASSVLAVLDAFEFLLVETPWPVVAVVILIIAWRVAGLRTTVFAAAALSYLAIFGFWEQSMTTVALLGAAALISIVTGLPLGIWCAHNSKIYAGARPVLDFMQTLPAFVYLIPVIAFFGTGKVPAIIATLMLGIPPMVRLTALGLLQVPIAVREAATAFGATKWQLLLKVELPLAMPSIMTGINQAILFCLSMVVIASLIGAKGLGYNVLHALQFAAVGEGILSGLAILFCAMIIDRIVQSSRKTYTQKK